MVPKFRAWEERYKKYINGVLIDCNGKVYFDDDVATQDDLDISVERSTGIKDVNGNVIYEGDILEYYYETRGQTFYDPYTLGAVGGEPGIETTVIGRVAIWPSTGVVLTGIKAKYPEDFDSNNSDIPKTLHVNRHFEVVGNVHENLGLLEAGK